MTNMFCTRSSSSSLCCGSLTVGREMMQPFDFMSLKTQSFKKIGRKKKKHRSFFEFRKFWKKIEKEPRDNTTTVDYCIQLLRHAVKARSEGPVESRIVHFGITQNRWPCYFCNRQAQNEGRLLHCKIPKKTFQTFLKNFSKSFCLFRSFDFFLNFRLR